MGQQSITHPSRQVLPALCLALLALLPQSTPPPPQTTPPPPPPTTASHTTPTPATATHLTLPPALTLDENQNLYIADTANHRIRRIATTGIITTIAGNGTQGFSGDSGP